MDTRFLESLVVVVDCGSVAEAARVLNISPAAVKQRIGVLEAEIGASLLERSGRVLRPTAIASTILAQARSIVANVRDLTAAAASKSLAGELRLFAIQTALSGLVPDILRALAREHPRITVRIFRGNSSMAYQQVVLGEVDAAITSEPLFALPKSLAWGTLREEPFVLLMPRKMRVRPAARMLEEEPFIRLDRNVYAGKLIEAYLRRTGVQVRELYELDGLEAIAIMVDRGLGVSILPDWAPPWPAGLHIRKVPIHDARMKRRTGLLWRRGALSAGLVQTFLQTAKDALAVERSGGGLGEASASKPARGGHN